MKNHLNECSYLATLGKSEPSSERSNQESRSKFIKFKPLSSIGKFPYNSSNLGNSNSNASFETKINLLKTFIRKIKIDWREGCCNLTLNRQRALEESIKQISKINIFKVDTFITLRNLRLILKEKFLMMQGVLFENGLPSFLKNFSPQ